MWPNLAPASHWSQHFTRPWYDKPRDLPSLGPRFSGPRTLIRSHNGKNPKGDRNLMGGWDFWHHQRLRGSEKWTFRYKWVGFCGLHATRYGSKRNQSQLWPQVGGYSGNHMLGGMLHMWSSQKCNINFDKISVLDTAPCSLEIHEGHFGTIRHRSPRA